MIDVEYFDCEREVAFVNRVKPLPSVGDVQHRFRQSGESPVKLVPQVLAELLASVRRRDVCRRVEIAVRFVVACL